MEKEQEKLIKAVNAELEEWLCSGDTDYLHKAMAVIRAEIDKIKWRKSNDNQRALRIC